VSSLDDRFMSRGLSLAEAAIGLASPNPTVGCVLVRDEIVLGEGVHHYDRRDHAEIVALKQTADPRGATAYVTLEPCSHHGRTGPCADALIAAGVARCVVATVDPNPLVSGQGMAKLRAAGIEVDAGVFESRARALNNAFALSITQHRPFVTLKAALSVDGRIAPPPSARTPNQPYLLTGPKSRAEVQRLRHASDAILFGIGTVLADDPLMTDRSGLPRRRPLMRVLLDSHLRIPLSAKLVETAQQDLWMFCGLDAPANRIAALVSLGIRVTQVSAYSLQLTALAPGLPVALDLREILVHLHAAQFLGVLVEAGSAINGAFLRQNLVDQAVLFYAETELGPAALPFADGAAGPFALEEQMLSVTKRAFGDDICVSGLLHDPWSKTPKSRLSQPRSSQRTR
jgi:diaminohydroxyphosphoribosylaminopyrimidine deaminase/5-amino-6-(5-phosphoribosylamino)uracil reductase